MSPGDHARDLWEKAKALPPMTAEERRLQRIDFAYGNLACMARYVDATPEELADLRAMVEAAASALEPT